MDIARVLFYLNPAYTYRLASSQATTREDIIEWRGPGEMPSQVDMDAAWQQIISEDAAVATTETEHATARSNLASMLRQAISDSDAVLTNWSSLTPAQKDAVLKRNTQAVRAILIYLAKDVERG